MVNKKMIAAIIVAVGLLLLTGCKGDNPQYPAAGIGSKGDNSQDTTAGIDALVKKWMKAGKIPGLSVGVVKNDKVIFLKGYGIADKETLRPVTARTTFFIASGAKPFTAMIMGLLVNDGKLEWDTPIRNYLPGLEMVDKYAEQHITTRDLLSHRIALARHGQLWKSYLGTQRTRRDFMKEFAKIKPFSSFRENLRYQNLGYILAAHTAEKLTGLTWEELVMERIFKPLGMNNSIFTAAEMKAKGDFAVPYRRKGKKELRTAFPDTGIAGPANGIYTNAEDVTRWLRLHLSGGRVKGDRFIPEKIIKEMHTTQMPYRQYPYAAEWITVGYGLGWVTEIYRGHYLLQHGGAYLGFQCMIGFLPFDNIGVAVLSNNNDTEAPNCLMRNIVDILLGVEPLPLKI